MILQQDQHFSFSIECNSTLNAIYGLQSMRPKEKRLLFDYFFLKLFEDEVEHEYKDQFLGIEVDGIYIAMKTHEKERTWKRRGGGVFQY